MTRRGFWFLAFSAGALILSVALPAQFSLTLFSLTALLWFACQWSMLQLRADLVARKLRLVRSINGQDASRATLWEDRAARMKLALEFEGLLGLPFVRVVDRLPAGVEARGHRSAQTSGDRRSPIELEYEFRPLLPGFLRFEGVYLELTDGAGFFVSRVFLRQTDVITVMPGLVVDSKPRSVRKKGNRIPAHGIHRHLQAGSGSELLNLRDYQMGDPPKRIAWKISARRDQLTTKDYESEVPIRATIFVDHSDSVRMGWPGPTPLELSIQIAATLIRRLVEHRDPVGLCLVGGEEATYIPPAAGRRQETRLLRELCNVAMEPPRATYCPANSLIETAHRACDELYPELLHPRLNRRYLRYEWGIGWSFLLSLAPLMIGVGLAGTALLMQERGGTRSALAAGIIGTAISLIMLILRRSWRSKEAAPRVTRKQRRQRKEVSSVVAAVRQLGPSGLAMMMDHDETFSRSVQEFLIDHRVPYRRPLYDDRGRYVFGRHEKIAQAGRSLLRSIAHAHDNEMFILLIDLFGQESEWGPLLDAIKIARARHHDVLVVSPWPTEFAIPALRTAGEPTVVASKDTAELSHAASLADEYFRAHDRLSRELSRVGVTLALAQMPETVNEVLRRVETMRYARIPLHH